MENLIRKTFEAKVKSRDDEKLIVEHFISTESVDRHGDIVRASGMKVRGKPVVLLQHGRGHMGAEPVAKPIKITRGDFKGEKGVVAVTQFFPDDLGKRLYEKTSGGFMPNWSIGFIPINSEPRKDAEGNPTDGRDIKKWELLEYSIVGVPAQPDAQTVPGKKEEGAFDGITFKMITEGDKEDICTECGGPLVVEHEFDAPGDGGPTEVTFCPLCKEKAEAGGLPKCAACADTKVVRMEDTRTKEVTEEVCPVCFFWPPDWGKEKWDEEMVSPDGLKYYVSRDGHPIESHIREAELVEKPFPNEHACRVADPKGFDKFRRQNNKFGEGIHAIWGIKGSTTSLQAIRFDSKKFTAAQAKKWASDHDHKCMMFEAATGKDDLAEILSTIKEAFSTLSVEFSVLRGEVNSLREELTELQDKSITSREPADGDPDPTLTGDKGDNPPERKSPRLVFVEKKEGSKKRDRIIGVITEALDEEFARRYRKDILGKVD